MIEHLPLVLAQIDPTGGYYELLLKNGVLGGAVGILIWFLIKRDADLQRIHEARLTDAKALAEVLRTHTSALQASNVANDERNRALEVSARASEKTALVIEQLAKEIAEIKDAGK